MSFLKQLANKIKFLAINSTASSYLMSGREYSFDTFLQESKKALEVSNGH